MRKQSVRDVDVRDKRVLVRAGFNVPLSADGVVLDDLRVRAVLPTIEHLRGEGAKLILCSHLGRPNGRVVESLRLAPVAARLAELPETPISAPPDCVGPAVASAVAALASGGVVLLENLRFHAEEEANEPDFALQLASPADLFVNDAFGVAHRAHASTEGVTHHLQAVAGLLMEKELDYLDRVVAEPARPVGAIIGGAKVSDKMAVLSSLLAKIDVLVIGGGMANTFLKAAGNPIGDSLVEDDWLETAREVVAQADESGVNLLLPVDVVVADRFDAGANAQTLAPEHVADGWRILDAGPRSIESYAEALASCNTIVWNGPLGVAEFPQFARGSESLARALVSLDATTIVGGGETAALVRNAGLADKFDHISTGGGAFLEALEGRQLPGVAALLDA